MQPIWKTEWRFLKKLKLELPYDPVISALGIQPDKTIIQKDTCTPMFIAALFTIARTCVGMHAKLIQLRPILRDAMDYSPPGCFVHGIKQARILKRVVEPFSRGSSQPRD